MPGSSTTGGNIRSRREPSIGAPSITRSPPSSSAIRCLAAYLMDRWATLATRGLLTAACREGSRSPAGFTSAARAVPRVSVILVTYNQAKYLPKAVASVRGQTFKDYEVIVMDDGTVYDDDGVLDLIFQADRWTCSEATDEDRRSECRYARLINEAARDATGDYLTYLSGDDWYLPDRLERMVAVLEAKPSWSVVYGAQRLYNDPVD